MESKIEIVKHILNLLKVSTKITNFNVLIDFFEDNKTIFNIQEDILVSLQTEFPNRNDIVCVRCILMALKCFDKQEFDENFWNKYAKKVSELYTYCLCTIIKINQTDSQGNFMLTMFTSSVTSAMPKSVALAQATFLNLFPEIIINIIENNELFFDNKYLLVEILDSIIKNCWNTSFTDINSLHIKLFANLSNWMVTFGDYETQSNILLVLVYIFESFVNKNVCNEFFISYPEIKQDFFKRDFQDFDVNARIFLNKVNMLNKNAFVFSLDCVKVLSNGVELEKPNDPGYSMFWVDFNVASESVLIYVNSNNQEWYSFYLRKKHTSNVYSIVSDYWYILDEGIIQIVKLCFISNDVNSQDENVQIWFEMSEKYQQLESTFLIPIFHCECQCNWKIEKSCLPYSQSDASLCQTPGTSGLSKNTALDKIEETMSDSDDFVYDTPKINKTGTRNAVKTYKVRKTNECEVSTSNQMNENAQRQLQNEKWMYDNDQSTSKSKSHSTKRKKLFSLIDNENSNIQSPFKDQSQVEESCVQRSSTYVEPTYSYRRHKATKPEDTYSFDVEDKLSRMFAEDGDCEKITEEREVVPNIDSSPKFNLNSKCVNKRGKSVYSDLSASMESNSSRRHVNRVRKAKRTKKKKTPLNLFSDYYHDSRSKNVLNAKQIEESECTPVQYDTKNYELNSENVCQFELPVNPQRKEKVFREKIVSMCPTANDVYLLQSNDSPLHENINKEESSPVRSVAENYELNTENLCQFKLPLNPQPKEKVIGEKIVQVCHIVNDAHLLRPNDSPLHENINKEKITESISQLPKNTKQEYTDFWNFGNLLYDQFVESCQKNRDIDSIVEGRAVSNIVSHLEAHKRNLDFISSDLKQMNSMVSKINRTINLERKNIVKTKCLVLKSLTICAKKRNVFYDSKRQMKSKILELAKQYIDNKSE